MIDCRRYSRSGSTSGRGDCCDHGSRGACRQGGNCNNSGRLRDGRRPDPAWPRGEPEPAGRQHHRRSQPELGHSAEAAGTAPGARTHGERGWASHQSRQSPAGRARCPRLAGGGADARPQPPCAECEQRRRLRAGLHKTDAIARGRARHRSRRVFYRPQPGSSPRSRCVTRCRRSTKTASSSLLAVW